MSHSILIRKILRKKIKYSTIKTDPNQLSSFMLLPFLSLSLASDWLLFLSRMKMSGDLPLLSLSLSDLRLQEILQLAQSIPLPEAGDEDQELEDMDVFSVSLIDPQGAIFSPISLTYRAVDVAM